MSDEIFIPAKNAARRLGLSHLSSEGDMEGWLELWTFFSPTSRVFPHRADKDQPCLDQRQKVCRRTSVRMRVNFEFYSHQSLA
jgi:hypothetical protein